MSLVFGVVPGTEKSWRVVAYIEVGDAGLRASASVDVAEHKNEISAREHLRLLMQMLDWRADMSQDVVSMVQAGRGTADEMLNHRLCIRKREHISRGGSDDDYCRSTYSMALELQRDILSAQAAGLIAIVKGRWIAVSHV